MLDLRWPPGPDPDALVAPFMTEAERRSFDMGKRFPEVAIEVERLTATPPLAWKEVNPAETLTRKLLSYTGLRRVVPYAAEAVHFQEAGFPTVISGPGSIEQTHRPDEYIERKQIERAADFMVRFAEKLASRPCGPVQEGQPTVCRQRAS